MKNLSQKERTFVAICIGWAFLHLIFLAVGWDGSFHHTFWPFDKYYYDTYEDDMKQTYDLSEFLVYAGVPFVAFFIYRLINSRE